VAGEVAEFGPDLGLPVGGRSAAGPVPVVLVGPRAVPAWHRAAVRGAGRAAPPPRPPGPCPARPPGRGHPPSGRPVRQRLQGAAQSDAGIREIPLAAEVVAATRRQLPPGTDPSALVFTGPGGSPGGHGGPGCQRAPHRAVAPQLPPHLPYGDGQVGRSHWRAARPTAARVLTALRAGGLHSLDQLTATLAEHGRAIRPTTAQIVLGEFVAAGLVAKVGEDTSGAVPSVPFGSVLSLVWMSRSSAEAVKASRPCGFRTECQTYSLPQSRHLAPKTTCLLGLEQ
jgi:hypothetical protein